MCVIIVLLFQGGVCTCVNVFFLLQERHNYCISSHSCLMSLHMKKGFTLVPMQYNFPTPTKRPPYQLASTRHVSCIPAESPALVLCLLCILQKQNCCTLISILCTQCIPLSCRKTLVLLLSISALHVSPAHKRLPLYYILCVFSLQKSPCITTQPSCSKRLCLVAKVRMKDYRLT